MDFEDLGLVDWEHHLPPPAAKAVVENLPRTVISSSKAGEDTALFFFFLFRADKPDLPSPTSHQQSGLLVF